MPNERWDYVLASLDDDAWPSLLGETYETLNALTPGKGIGNKAPVFLTEMVHPMDILRDSKKRSRIISVLPREYASELCRDLNVGCEDTQSMYDGLREIKYSKKVEKAFMDFFGIDPKPRHEEDVIIGVETITDDLLEYPLRKYQRQIVHDIEVKISEGSRRIMVQMPTGSGKTRTAMYFIAKQMNETENYTVLWLAYSKELCTQASDEFSKIWRICGNRETEIYRFYGNSECEIPSNKFNGVVFSTLSKINSQLSSDDLFIVNLSKNIDVVVFDEAHQIVAPTYQNIVRDVVDLNERTLLLGLTATPGRTWNDPDEDKRLSDFFNHNIISIVTENGESPVEMLTRHGYLSEIIWDRCDCDTPVLDEADLSLIRKMKEDDELPERVLNKLSKDVKRNTKILSKIEDLLNDGYKRILVFATSVEHTKMLSGLLKVLLKDTVPNCQVGYVVGDTDAGTRDHIINSFKAESDDPFILCNYNVLTTGFDAPNIDAGVIARPTRSLVLFSQMVGRMIRGPMSNGTQYAKIVTVVDIGLPGFKDSSYNWVDVWERRKDF